MGAEEVVGPSPLLDEEGLDDEVLILHIRKEVEEGNLPADVASSLEELYYNYKNAVKTAGFDLCSIFNVLLSDCCSSRLANILLSGSENW